MAGSCFYSAGNLHPKYVTPELARRAVKYLRGRASRCVPEPDDAVPEAAAEAEAYEELF
jgi:hypothetical protein